MQTPFLFMCSDVFFLQSNMVEQINMKPTVTSLQSHTKHHIKSETISPRDVLICIENYKYHWKSRAALLSHNVQKYFCFLL